MILKRESIIVIHHTIENERRNLNENTELDEETIKIIEQNVRDGNSKILL